MSKLVLTSASNIISLVKSNPELYNVPGFSSLKTQIEKITTPAGGCTKCGAGKINAQLKNLHPQIQTILRNMKPTDYQTMKTILKLDELCYYITVDGKLTLKCL